MSDDSIIANVSFKHTGGTDMSLTDSALILAPNFPGSRYAGTAMHALPLLITHNPGHETTSGKVRTEVLIPGYWD
jgi:hypothetical protein